MTSIGRYRPKVNMQENQPVIADNGYYRDGVHVPGESGDDSDSGGGTGSNGGRIGGSAPPEPQPQAREDTSGRVFDLFGNSAGLREYTDPPVVESASRDSGESEEIVTPNNLVGPNSVGARHLIGPNSVTRADVTTPRHLHPRRRHRRPQRTRRTQQPDRTQQRRRNPPRRAQQHHHPQQHRDAEQRCRR